LGFGKKKKKKLAILCYSQDGDDPQEDLAKFGYKLNMKAIF
jgi:hypothetical protein